MPLYSIKGPDGNTYQIEGPEGATREQIIDAIQYKLGRQAKPAVKPETTFGGNVREFFKGLAPGAVGLVESAAVGASALLPKDTEESARKRIAEIAGAAKAPFAAAPGYEDTIPRKFGEAVGSIAPFLALGPAGIAGRAGMAALGTGAGAGEARTRAEQEGATAEQRGTATALGSVVGISEMFAPMRILGRLADPIKAGAVAQLKRIAAAGGEEAAQEAAAQIAQNLIAKGVYKPEQAIIEQVGESAAYGGAVGALAQGLLDMALGRRVKGAGAGTPDEIAQARAEADAAAAAEAERKASPEYAQQFVADYDARKQAFVDARKTLQRPGKDATPDAWEAYKEQRTALEEMRKSLAKDAKEYNQLAPKLKEEARRAALQPEDVMLEQLGMKVEPVEPPKTRMAIDEFGQVTEVPEGQEAAEPVSAPQQYLTQQVEAARGFGQLALADYADFAMQDPKMAAEIVKSRIKLPTLTTAENNALLSGINLRLKEAEKQRAAETKALYEQRSADLKAQQPTPEITNELAGIEQYLAETAERGPAQVEPTFEYLDPIFEQAFNQPPTIKISDKVQPIKNAPAIRDRIESLMQQADQADQDYRTARAARQPDAALAAKNRGVAAVQEIESLSKEGNEYSKEFLAARKGQNEALAGLQDVVDRLRTGQVLGKETFVDEKGRVQRVEPGKGAAASTEQTLTSKAEQLRAQLITNALQEAALHRRAAGQSQITQDEAIKAASKLYDTVDTLISRAKTEPEQAEFEEVIVQPAQMRGTKIVKPAVTERREVKPAVAGLSPAEIKHFTERIDAVRRQLIEPPKGEAVRVEPALKTQFAATEAAKVAEARGETAETVGGELRRRTEFVRDKMAKMGGMRPMARDVLNKAADLMDAGQASKDLLDAVEPVVDAITSKRQVTQTDLRAINDALTAAKPTAAEQQAQGQQALNLLFEEPGQRPRLVQKDLGFIRKSFENFENSPALKKARLAVDQAKKLAKQMADTRAQEEQARKETVKKESKAQERRVLTLERAVRQQRNDLQQAVYDAIEAERQALTDAQKLASAPAIKAAEQAVADAEKALSALEQRLETLTENIQFPWMDAVKKEKASIRGRIGYQQTVVQNAKNELAQVVAESHVQYENAAVVARANQDSLVQFERKALEKFEQRLDKLRKQVQAPSAELAAAQKAADEQRARVATEEKNARDAAEKANKEQRELEQRRLSGLGLPGVKRVAGETVEIEAAKDAELTKALAEAYERSKQAQDAVAGVKPDIPQVPRATGPVARGVRTQVGKLSQARTPKQPEVETAVAEANVLAAEKAAKEPEKTKAETAKETAARQTQMREAKERLENTTRAQLADVNIRIEAMERAIKPNPERIQELKDERAALQRQLVAARQDIEKEGELEKKTQRELKKEQRAQAKQEAERGAQEGLFRTTAKAGSSLKEQTVKKIADKVTVDWTVVPEVVVVADENGLPEKIRKQATAQGVTGTIPGVYDPSTKTTYLVASNLKDAEDVVLTIAHEVAGHFGLREVLGSSYARTMQRLYEGNKLVRQRADAKMQEQKFLDQNTAVEEVLADMAETGATPQERNVLQRVYDYLKRWLKTKFPSLNLDRVSDNDVRQVVANARRYVLEGDTSVLEGGTAATSGLVYRTAKYASPEMEAAAKKLDPFVAKQRSVNERVRAASGGFLGLETMLVDRFAGFERLAKYLPEHLGTQMMYYLRMYDMRMNMVSEAVANGAPSLVTKTRKDGKTERLLEAKEGPNIKRTVEILREANPMVGNAEAVNRLFTAYMAGIRADNKGFDTLNFGEDVTPEMLKDALSVVNNNPALKKIFDNARSEYNAYNRNLVEFLVETGAVSQDVANRLMAENDYIPFYRERGGVAELLIGKEAPIKIGSIKEQPYLQQLVGGDQPILDFLTSSVQNTNFLVDMGMRNLATKNAIYELVDLNAAKIVGGTPSGTNVVKFKDKGVDKYAVLATEKVKIGNKEFETGVPADILVKGMEGVPTQMPALLRAFAMPAQLLRKGVTLSPLYVARQIFRDSLAAPILAGANFPPVLGALRQIGSPTKGVLERRGITGGQQFTGTSDDLSMILRDVADGKPGWMSLLAKAEGLAMSADALTRRAQYNSYIEQGLSEMEATLMSLESMNFSKRGASPSIQIANSMIPFFNAQIQGLNVMYKALTGKMPLNDKLKLRTKLLQRGGMMAAASMIYAILMQDDDAYKNAEADQKYANWFVRIPGVDEPVRIPIPFEIGYIFKALPEAIVNSMASEEGGAQALKALRQIIIQTIPGGSSYGIPQALKPAIEAGLGKSFYTGRDILSAREKEMLPEEQFRANTAEISKLIGQAAGVSPVMLENLVRGYTGTMGLAFLHTLSLGVPPGEGPEKAVKRLSEYPVVGGAFQPNDAGAIVNSVYERMNDALKVERTYEKMVVEGRTAEANALLQRKGQEFMQAELANEFKTNMNQIVAAERAIQASNISGEEKRKQLDDLRKLKIAIAKEIRDVADKTIRLSFSL